MTGRELDLYDGLDARPPTAPESAGTTPPRPPSGRAGDWVELLWRRFPEAVRERFVPRGVIGEGGMGIVIEAHDRVLERVVAVKGVRDPSAISPAERARMAREAQLAARLTHPNILPVYDTWEDADHNPWCAMLRVPGAGPHGAAPTLATRLEELAHERDPARRPLAELVGLFLQACRGVSHAHARGIVHRDVKPANVLLGPSGEALVADWGVALDRARAADGEGGDVVGTPGYAAPEQLGLAGRARADERSDVYGLGVVLAEVLGGARPRAPGEPIALPRRVPREMASIVAHATARDADARFAGVSALQRAVEAYLAGELVEGLAYSRGERVAKWAARRPGVAVALAGALALALLFVYGVRRESARQAATTANLNAKVARMHAAAADRELAEGRADEARMQAAQAIAASLAGPPEFQLSARRAWSAFVSARTVVPLAWACRLPEPPAAVTFSTRGDELLIGTRQASLVRVPLADTRRTAHVRFAKKDAFIASPDPEGRWFAAGTVSGNLTLFDVSNQKPVAMPLAGERAWQSIFGPGSRTMLVSGERWAHVLDLPSMTERVRFGPFTTEVWGLAMTLDGALVAVAERGRPVRIFSTKDGSVVRALDAGTVLGSAFSPDGRWYYSGGAEATITRWDVATGRRTLAIGDHLANVMALEASPDGRVLASAGQDNVVRLWDAATGAPLAGMPGHTRWVWGLAFSPDGRYLASSADDQSVRLWDVAEAVRPRLRGRAAAVAALAFAPSGTRVAAAHQDRTVRVVGVDGREHARFLAPHACEAVALASTGRLTAAARAGGEAVALSISSPGAAWETLARVAVHRDAPPVALSADGGSLAAVAPGGAPVVVRFSGGAAQAASLPRLPLSTPTALALSPDGAYLAAGDSTGHVAWAELSRGTTAARLFADRRVTALAFAADGRWLAVGAESFVEAGAGTRVGAYDVVTGVGGVLSEPHLAPVSAIAVTRERGTVASGASDGLRLVRGTGARIRALELEDLHVNALAVSPDARLLAWSSDADVHVWDLAVPDDPGQRVRAILASSFFTIGPEDELVPRAPGDAPPARWAVSDPSPVRQSPGR